MRSLLSRGSAEAEEEGTERQRDGETARRRDSETERRRIEGVISGRNRIVGVSATAAMLRTLPFEKGCPMFAWASRAGSERISKRSVAATITSVETE